MLHCPIQGWTVKPLPRPIPAGPARKGEFLAATHVLADKQAYLLAGKLIERCGPSARDPPDHRCRRFIYVDLLAGNSLEREPSKVTDTTDQRRDGLITQCFIAVVGVHVRHARIRAEDRKRSTSCDRFGSKLSVGVLPGSGRWEGGNGIASVARPSIHVGSRLTWVG